MGAPYIYDISRLRVKRARDGTFPRAVDLASTRPGRLRAPVLKTPSYPTEKRVVNSGVGLHVVAKINASARA